MQGKYYRKAYYRSDKGWMTATRPSRLSVGRGGVKTELEKLARILRDSGIK